jgi:hypothetical protein
MNEGHTQLWGTAMADTRNGREKVTENEGPAQTENGRRDFFSFNQVTKHRISIQRHSTSSFAGRLSTTLEDKGQ